MNESSWILEPLMTFLLIQSNMKVVSGPTSMMLYTLSPDNQLPALSSVR